MKSAYRHHAAAKLQHSRPPSSGGTAITTIIVAVLVAAAAAHVVVAADLSYSTTENSPAGTVVAELGDAAALLLPRLNRTTLSRLRYGLLKDSDWLSVDERTGRLSVRRPLDREALCAYERRNELCLLAADVTLRMNAQIMRVAKVQVVVNDTNDNDPTFDKGDNVVAVSEAASVGSAIATLPVARDRDSDQFGIGSYTLRNGQGVFALQEKLDAVGQPELTLVLRQPLDRESVDAYRLVVEVYDRGSPSRSSTVSVNVIVLDDNDNAPRFERLIYSAAVPENMRGGGGVIVATVRATDADAGVNGQVRYALSPRASDAANRTFEIGEYTGAIKLRATASLDRESVEAYMVPVVARDGGQPARTATALVNVTVVDVNDNSPKLRLTALAAHNASEASVYENAPVDTPVALLSVVDEDEGDAGLVTCFLSTPHFGLRKYHTNEYELYVAAELDHEIVDKMSVAVHCTDLGNPPLTARATLTVNVLDVNDNAPAFDRYTYYAPAVPENNAVGATVVRVAAADSDSGHNAEIVYSLGQEHDAASFAVDAATGVITARATFDRETQKEYSFSVRATDGGAPQLSGFATIVVRVEDVNDNVPSFKQDSYYFTVDENKPKFTAFGQVQASDADDGPNGDLWYRLADDEAAPARQLPFAVAHDSGVLSTRAPLDRELTGTYQITVVAADYGSPARSSTAKVTISIGDENDNSPFILQPTAGNDTFNVTDWTANATTVLTVAAVDMDAGDNGRLGYFVHSGNDDGMFAISRTTGELRLVKDSRTVRAATAYHLVIGVFDCGVKPRTTFATLRVNLIPRHIDGSRYDSRLATRSSVGADDDGVEYIGADLALVIILCSLSGVLSILLIVAIVRVQRMPRHKRHVGCPQAMRAMLGFSDNSDDRDRRRRQRGPPQQPTCASLSIKTDLATCDYYAENECDDRRLEEQKFLTTFVPDGSVKAAFDRSNCNSTPDGRLRGRTPSPPLPERALAVPSERKSLVPIKNDSEQAAALLRLAAAVATKRVEYPGVHISSAPDANTALRTSGRRRQTLEVAAAAGGARCVNCLSEAPVTSKSVTGDSGGECSSSILIDVALEAGAE